MNVFKLNKTDLFEILKLTIIIMILLVGEWIFIGDLSFIAISTAILTIVIFVIAKISFKDLE